MRTGTCFVGMANVAWTSWKLLTILLRSAWLSHTTICIYGDIHVGISYLNMEFDFCVDFFGKNVI